MTSYTISTSTTFCTSIRGTRVRSQFRGRSDRVVDEMIFCFTHDREIDWMLPGVAPTGHYVEVPLVAIVCFRGGKLYNEHIYWDQASVLVQIGLLPRDGLPVTGIEATQKLVNEG